MDYIDPFTRLILEAEKAANKTSTPELRYDFEPEEEPKSAKPPFAVFTYSDESTLSIPFPRKPSAVVKRINQTFQRPISVRFRNVDANFKPVKQSNLTEWKQLCRSVVRPLPTNPES